MVFKNQAGTEFVNHLCALWTEAAVFVTVVLLGVNGEEVARATTIEEDGFDPCWDMAGCFARAAKESGAAALGWQEDFRPPGILDDINRPLITGAGLRLFRGDALASVLGVLGVGPKWVIDTVSKVATEYGLTVADLP